MMNGIVNLFCPICALFFRFGESSGTYKHSTFGILCSRKCMKEAEDKYARIVSDEGEL